MGRRFEGESVGLRARGCCFRGVDRANTGLEDGLSCSSGSSGGRTGSSSCGLNAECGGPIRLVGDGVDERASTVSPSCAEFSGPEAGRGAGVRISTQSRTNRGVIAFGVLTRGGVVGRVGGFLEGDNSNSSGSSLSLSTTTRVLLPFVVVGFFWRITRGRLGPGSGFGPAVERGAALRVREATDAPCGGGSTSVAASSAAVARLDLPGLDGGGATSSPAAALLDRSDLLGAGWISSVVVDALRFGGMFRGLAVVDRFAQPHVGRRMGMGATRTVTLCHSASVPLLPCVCGSSLLYAYSPLIYFTFLAFYNTWKYGIHRVRKLIIFEEGAHSSIAHSSAWYDGRMHPQLAWS